MKIQELSGGRLDYWVASILGLEGIRVEPNTACTYIDSSLAMKVRVQFSPSANWAQGGPLIERAGISIWRYDETSGDRTGMWFAAAHGIHGWDDGSIAGAGKECSGEAPLVAAMRAYVASKFGNEVPD
ncbi:2-oxoglutarate dehydrogenase E1 [Burkholderia aenigmatica]|uniref:phage protein NinX family protein n=1 Tax=Burkholderia aenigmatica TaxID=2015348 RepID=UPI001454A3C5|nr:phage protein NinX family protein [Burkholderia aenigmatica]VWD12397.1 2-oxoglutarate dehydrogenase E1 [Burkholderia aenigmatica]